MKLERVRGGMGRFDILHNSREGLWDAVFSLSVLRDKSPVPGCFCTVLESCQAVGAHGLTCSKWSMPAGRGISALQELQVTLSWRSSVNCACLGLPGSVLRGFSCGLATGTPQLPYSWLPFIISSSFFVLLNWSLFCCTFSRLCFVLLPGSMGNNCFLLSDKITAQSFTAGSEAI